MTGFVRSGVARVSSTSVRGGGKWLLGAAALSASIAMLAPAGAMAADANAVPPKLSLTPGGEQQGMLGAEDDYLAYFSTRDLDPESEYTVGSTVSFVCLVDGQPVPCEAEHFPARLVTAGPAISCPRRKATRRRPCRPRPAIQPTTEQTEAKGPFTGRVPVPAGLAGGSHTVTVIATDEDGTDPNPPSISITLDLEPPTAPKIVEGPPRVGRDAKPRIRFRSIDDHGFPAKKIMEADSALSVSVIMGVLLVFRTNSAYDRWWEARTVWGAIVNDSRTLARQIKTLSPRIIL